MLCRPSLAEAQGLSGPLAETPGEGYGLVRCRLVRMPTKNRGYLPRRYVEADTGQRLGERLGEILKQRLFGALKIFDTDFLLLGTPGYTFGLGFMLRCGDGIAGVHGTAGEFKWAGFAGTFFWAEPKEQLCTVRAMSLAVHHVASGHTSIGCADRAPSSFGPSGR